MGFLSDSNKALQENVDKSQPRILASYALVGAILLFGGLGYAVDRWRDTSPWFLLIGLCVGIAFGFYEVITSSRHS